MSENSISQSKNPDDGKLHITIDPFEKSFGIENLTGLSGEIEIPSKLNVAAGNGDLEIVLYLKVKLKYQQTKKGVKNGST